MTLINCLEGLTAKKSDGSQWSDIETAELGTYSSLSTHEVWTRSDGLPPRIDRDEDVLGTEAPSKLSIKPNDDRITGGIKLLVFHNWKDTRSGNEQQSQVIRNALAELDMPLWLPARLLTHSFYCDPSNRPMENSRPTRRYWQRFRGGLLMWSFDFATSTTRALFLCREEQYWTAFNKNLAQCRPYAALPLLPGVLAYIQQIKVSVSYIYWVRERVNSLLKEVNDNLVIVDTMSSQKSRSAHEEQQMHHQLANVEKHIWELVRCAQEAAGAIPYLTDNSGNLVRIVSSLAYIKDENEAYCKAVRDSKFGLTPIPRSFLNEAEELSGLIEDLQVELKSQSLAAEWITTKINALVQNTNLTINRADQRLNLLIADSSLTIAVEARRDNLSMVTIAAITMIFLPGTFVASFFAMPLLNWTADSSEAVVTRRFWVYWAVTIPLTIIVILCWLLCFWRTEAVRALLSLRERTKHQNQQNNTIPLNPMPQPGLTHGPAVAVTSAVTQHSSTGTTQYRPPRKTPTSEYRMAPNQRIDWSLKGSDAPMRYAV